MRVIAGKAKGRNLKYPKLPQGKRLRPLTGQVKGALFNILGAKIIDVSFLDLFAGTGSVGIEALSRGAKLALFVEMDRKIVEVLRQNLELTGFSDRSEVYCLDVLKAIKVLDQAGGKFNVIFIGAPYGNPILSETLKLLGVSKILANETIVIAEHSKRNDLLDEYGSLVKARDAKYGDTVLSFYSIREI